MEARDEKNRKGAKSAKNPGEKNSAIELVDKIAEH